MPTAQEFIDKLPPQQRAEAQQLQQSLMADINANRPTNKANLDRMRQLIDIARDGGHSAPQAPSGAPSATPVKDFVREAAELAVAIEMAQAHGMRPDPSYVQRLNEIDAMARARLSPEAYESGLKHFNEAKVQAHSDLNVMLEADRRSMADQAKQEEVSRYANNVAAALRDATEDYQGGMVQSKEELRDVADGKPRKIANPNKESLSREALEAQVQEHYGMDLDSYQAELDHIAEVQHIDPERAEKMRAKLGVDQETINSWTEGAGIELGLKLRAAERTADEPDEIEVQPSDDDSMSADMTFAMAENNEAHDKSLEAFKQDNAELLVGDNLHSDVARAWATVEEHQSQEG